MTELTPTGDRTREIVTTLADLDTPAARLAYLESQKLLKADLAVLARVLRVEAEDRDRKAVIAERIVEKIATPGVQYAVRTITNRHLHYAIETTGDGGATWEPMDVPCRHDDSAIRPADSPYYRASAVESHAADDPTECAANIATYYRLAALAESTGMPWRVRVWIGTPTGQPAAGHWVSGAIAVHVDTDAEGNGNVVTLWDTNRVHLDVFGPNGRLLYARHRQFDIAELARAEYDAQVAGLTRPAPLPAGRAVTVAGGEPVSRDVADCLGHLGIGIGDRVHVGRVIRSWIHPTTKVRWYEVSMNVTGETTSRPAEDVASTTDPGWDYPGSDGSLFPVIYEVDALQDDGRWGHERAEFSAANGYDPAELNDLASRIARVNSTDTRRRVRVSVIPAKEEYRYLNPDHVGYATDDPPMQRSPRPVARPCARV